MLKTPLLSPFEVVIFGERKDKPLYRVSVQAFTEDEAKEMALQQYRSTLHPGDLQPRISRVDVCDGIRITPHQRQRGLFEDLADCCVGERMEDVQGAAVNLLLTALQRAASDISDAERRWDELSARAKQALRRRMTGQADNRDRSA